MARTNRVPAKAGANTVASQAGFYAFLTRFVNIPAALLPATSQFVAYAYQFATSQASQALQASDSFMYDTAVYNLGTDVLINVAVDADGSTYFEDLRKKYNCNNFVAGVITSTSDEGSSVSLDNPEFMKQLTLSDLQNLKTPWGRQYLAIAQQTGTNWGLT